jgi:hypothetical protein
VIHLSGKIDLIARVVCLKRQMVAGDGWRLLPVSEVWVCGLAEAAAAAAVLRGTPGLLVSTKDDQIPAVDV